ncbi:MAG: DUF2914 domain-containing protein [Syntrophobacteraceae bacterium]
MKLFSYFLSAFLLITCSCHAAPAQGSAQPQPPGTAAKLHLKQAVMCQRVENLTPVDSGVVFSVSSGQVCCYTSFDSVPRHTVIYHRWYHRDELSTQTRLRLYPKKWSTYSVIQLRETDVGPWRVEVVDQNGRILDTLRFSITD